MPGTIVNDSLHLVKRAVAAAVRSTGYAVTHINERPSPADTFQSLYESLLRRQLALNSDFYFAVVGANDGIRNDHSSEFIRSNRLRGVMLEPHPAIFETLRQNYADQPQILLRNAALHAENASMTLYYVDPDASHLDEWANGISSFDPVHHRRCGIPSELIKTLEVDCITWNDLVYAYDITSLDLLQIDTEGYDYDIVMSIDFDIVSPHIIRFEHNLTAGTMPKQHMSELSSMLIERGYYLMMERFDAVAFKPHLLLPD